MHANRIDRTIDENLLQTNDDKIMEIITDET